MTNWEKEMLILGNYYEIKKMILSGYTVIKISKEIGVSTKFINMYFSIKKPVDIFGHKDQAYFTEEEMLTEKEYLFKNLSNDEKEIYNQRKKAGLLGSYFTSNDGLYGGY